jgi:hypothetical protein
VKDDRALNVVLGSDKIAFLEEMATRYALSDLGKALRCIVDYARENPDKHENIFNEPRCLDC